MTIKFGAINPFDEKERKVLLGLFDHYRLKGDRLLKKYEGGLVGVSPKKVGTVSRVAEIMSIIAPGYGRGDFKHYTAHYSHPDYPMMLHTGSGRNRENTIAALSADDWCVTFVVRGGHSIDWNITFVGNEEAFRREWSLVVLQFA